MRVVLQSCVENNSVCMFLCFLGVLRRHTLHFVDVCIPDALQALGTVLGMSPERVNQLVSTRPVLLLKEPTAVQIALNAARKRGEL